MIVIWRGIGPIVPIFCIVAAILTNTVTSFIFSEENYFAHHAWPPALAFWIAASACWPLGRKLNRKQVQLVVDKKTGKEFMIRRSPAHHIMFIPLEYWAPILFAFGLVVLIIGLTRG